MAKNRGMAEGVVALKQQALDDAVGELKALRDQHNVLLVACKICRP